MHRFFLLFIILLLCVCSSASFAQKMPRQHKRIPYFFTLNSERLAKRLTHSLDSDSAKALAIHSWITYNIKYDVKKWQRFNYERVAVKKVLRRRKAICVGYSDLFTELCGHAGLKAVQVSGYTKNPNVDIIDTFYLDDHMWNAVLIDSKWKLVDATWDAGYVAYYKMTLPGYIVYPFTLGRVRLLKYKPHFKRYPIHAYFLRPGTFFKTDHLPLNPLWQVMEPEITIEEFRRDSSYYYKEYDFRAPDTGNKYGAGTDRSDYASNKLEEREKADGISGHRFNDKNHYCIANTWSIRVEETVKEIDPGSQDTAAQMKVCDTIIERASKGIAHYDTNVVMLLKQKGELTANNIAKKKLFIANNNKLTESTKNCIRKLTKGRKSSKSAKQYCRKLSKDNTKRHRAIAKDRSFYKIDKADPNPERRNADSLRLAQEIKAIDDSIANQRYRITQHFSDLDSTYELMVNRHREYSQGVNTSRTHLIAAYSTRLQYYDDNDHEVRVIEDTLLKRKPISDALLDLQDKYVLQYSIDELKASKPAIAQQYKNYKSKIKLLKKMRAVCVNDTKTNEAYEAMLDSFSKENAEWKSELRVWNKRLTSTGIYCKKQKRKTRKELKAFKRIRSLEFAMCNVRSSYINKHHASLVKLSKEEKKRLLLHKRAAERQKQKLAEKK